MHNSLIPNPNDVEFVTQLKRDEITTTFMKKPFSFGVHIKVIQGGRSGHLSLYLENFTWKVIFYGERL